MKKITLLLMLAILVTGCQATPTVSDCSEINNSSSSVDASIANSSADNTAKVFRQSQLVEGEANYGITYLWLDDTRILLCAMNLIDDDYTNTFSVLKTDTDTNTAISPSINQYCSLFSSVETPDGYRISDFSGNDYMLSAQNILQANKLPFKEQNLSSFYDVDTGITYQFDADAKGITQITDGVSELLCKPSLAQKEYIACMRIAPDKSSLVFAVMREFYSSKTMFYEFETKTLRTVPIVLGLPGYFWLNNMPIALSFDDNNDGTYAFLLNGAQPMQKIKLCDKDESIDFSSGTYQYGAAANAFPFVLRTKTQNKLMLLNLENSIFDIKEVLQTTNQITQPKLSKDGKQIAYFSFDTTQDTPDLVVRSLA